MKNPTRPKVLKAASTAAVTAMLNPLPRNAESANEQNGGAIPNRYRYPLTKSASFDNAIKTADLKENNWTMVSAIRWYELGRSLENGTGGLKPYDPTIAPRTSLSASTDTKVSPIPSSNCFASTLLV